MSSDVVCQRQTYSSGNVDYSYLEEFLTLSRSQSALLPVSCGPEQAQEQDVCMNKSTCNCVHMYVRTYLCLCVCMDGCTYICMYVFTYVCVI